LLPLELVASGKGGRGTLSGTAPRLDLPEHRHELRKGRTGIGGWSGLNPLASQLGTSGVNYFDVNGGPVPLSRWDRNRPDGLVILGVQNRHRAVQLAADFLQLGNELVERHHKVSHESLLQRSLVGRLTLGRSIKPA